MEKRKKYRHEYPQGTLPPPGARFALYYLGYVRYYRSDREATKAHDRLDWYSRQSAAVVRL